MKKYLLAAFLLVSMIVPCFAVATNLYTVPKTSYSTVGATVTFPSRVQGFMVVNFDSTSSLMVTYQGNTIEVDPNVSPWVSLDAQFTSLYLRGKTTAVSAEVVAVY